MSLTEPGYSGAFTVSGNSDPTVASASIGSSILTISPLKGGGNVTAISVSDAYKNTATCTVTVN